MESPGTELRSSAGKILFLTALILVLSALTVSSQIYPFREYNVLDGLPQSQATRIFQDSRGFIWISTNNGVARFDGIEFVNYTRRDGLPTNDFTDIMEDSLGVIWTTSDNHGLSKFDGIRFQYFPIENNLEGNPSPSVKEPYISNAIYFLSTWNGKSNIRIFRFSKGKYIDYSSRFEALDTLSLEKVCLTKEEDAFLIFDIYRNIWTWKDSVLRLVSRTKYDNLIYQKLTAIIKNGDNFYEYTDGKLKNWPLENPEGEVRAGWDFGSPLTSVSLFDGKVLNKIDLPFVPTNAFLDREGVLWFPSEKNVQRLVSTAFSSFSQPNMGIGNIWAIGEDRDGHLWFGSLYGDLMEYDGTGFRKRNDYEKIFGKETAFYKGSRKMSNGDLWLSTGRGILVWDGKFFSRLKELPYNSEICYIYEDPDTNTIMVGAGEGLYIFRGGKSSFRRSLNDSELGVVEGITKTSDGTYWLSGHKGLVTMNGDSISPVSEDVFPHIDSYTMEADRYDGLWVTSEDGLYFKRKQDDRFTLAFPESLNAPANSIIQMDSNHILVGRVSDISIIDIDKFYKDPRNGFRMYDKTDGFNGDDCLDNGIIRDMDGNFWINTSTSVVKLEPSRLRINPVPPVLNFTGVYFKTDSLDWVPATKQGFYYRNPTDINLNPKHRTIKISYSGISTTNPEKVTYRYRLTGFNEKWSLPVKEREVIYENLPHGRYRFELTASNADGISTEKPVSIEFRLLPFFWQTPLFIILATLLFIVVNFVITKYVIRKRHERQADEQKLKSELAHLQMSSVLAQFNPHFTFNVISSVGSLIMKEKKDSAYEYITRLSGLLRSVLNDGSIIVKPLADELDFVISYCELQKLRFKDRLNYSINVGRDVDKTRMIPKMTIQTFVENSIKHGIEHRREGGRVDIQVIKKDSCLEILIVDDGIGRESAFKYRSSGTGHGLKTITDIFDMMNKFNKSHAGVHITDLPKEGPVTGTRVRIVIPDDYHFDNI
jgi:ligand-binding sensor domain-containing protein